MEKLLFTGGTGFLGKNTRPLLDKMYEVTTCGITHDDMIKANLVKDVPELEQHYDIVLHACGKAHVLPKSEAEISSFYDVNYVGTIHLCNALEKVGVPKALIFISTVAVYGCEFGDMITEEHLLEGKTPYAASKIKAEQYLTEWCAKNNVKLGILRPSLLAGKNALGNLGAMVNGVNKGFYMNIAGGKVIKSILMAEDIANLVPLVAEKGGVYNVCDTKQPSFGQISQSVAKQLRKGKPLSIPYWMAWCMAKVGDLLGNRAPINTYKLEKMTKSLTFSNDKARKELNWEPIDVLSNYRV
ncbi:NAD-dependent epimerase/dehydratase family protein [Bacteroides ihuae]|uniref:NAD-dependent epimerase/dehydratase family protein n=1 Tax=Bacteroides ihuae TaxID=1852362 RepID=UPI0008D9D009|nr:NAD-dependent epimerase/dehydratase family protein [Bacteroides ihuae]